MLVELGAPANGLAMDAPIARAKAGRPNNADVVTITDRGNSESYLVGRLKRDHPALADDVIAGRLSAHAAAVQAGIKKQTWTAPQDVDAFAKAIERRTRRAALD
jgi:hypothetical protein